jgi:hypothetical protein
MLGKLFKYEWRSITKLLLPIHGCVLLFALLSRFYFALGGGVENLLNSSSGIISVLTGLLIFALVVIISSVVIFTYVYIGYHFYKKVFTDQGYLTNTLPVTPTQLLLSKGLAAVPWLLIDILVIIISCLILAGTKDLFSSFRLVWPVMLSQMGQMPLLVALTIFAIILSPFQMIITLFFSVTVGNLASTHKVLASIAAYIGIYILQQIFGFIELIIIGFSNYGTFMNADLATNATISIDTYLNPVLAVNIIFCILLMIACWIGSRYILSKKLNLQ